MSNTFEDAEEPSQKPRPHSSVDISSACHIESSSNLAESFGQSEFKWKSSSKYIDPGYGYERDWRSSRARVEGGGDSHLARAVAPLALEDGKQWRSSIRYIDPGMGLWDSQEWRSSIKAVRPKSQGEPLQWKPAVRVFKLSDCCTEWKMSSGRRHVTSIEHGETVWRSSRGPGSPPPLKWAPPFRNMKLVPMDNKELRRKVPAYTVKHPHLQLFPETLNMAVRSNQGTLLSPNMKEIRTKVQEYFEQHPPLHLFSTSVQESGHGKNGDSNDSYHSIRRYIPEGHEDHFENPACTTKISTVPPPKTLKLWCATGAQHDTANCRNVITGNIGPSDDWKPPRVTLGPSLLAPAGNYCKDIIDSRFTPQRRMTKPKTSCHSSQPSIKLHVKGNRKHAIEVVSGNVK